MRTSFGVGLGEKPWAKCDLLKAHFVVDQALRKLEILARSSQVAGCVKAYGGLSVGSRRTSSRPIR